VLAESRGFTPSALPANGKHLSLQGIQGMERFHLAMDENGPRRDRHRRHKVVVPTLAESRQ
jgi:hypothetical protein